MKILEGYVAGREWTLRELDEACGGGYFSQELLACVERFEALAPSNFTVTVTSITYPRPPKRRAWVRGRRKK
jgi:hypothetical protein